MVYTLRRLLAKKDPLYLPAPVLIFSLLIPAYTLRLRCIAKNVHWWRYLYFLFLCQQLFLNFQTSLSSSPYICFLFLWLLPRNDALFAMVDILCAPSRIKDIFNIFNYSLICLSTALSDFTRLKFIIASNYEVYFLAQRGFCSHLKFY